MLIFSLLLSLFVNVSGYCVIPDIFRGHAWKYRKLQYGHAHSTVTFAADEIIFKNEEDQSVTKQACVEMVDIRKYIFKEIVNSNEVYKCIEIVARSKSIIQLKSSISSSVKSRSLCSHAQMELDPWLLVSYETVNHDFGACPFSGGFNMKILDKNGVNHGCNYMELPMRFESDCLAGEGITFSFREDECTGFIPMSVFQKTMCIASWHQNFHIFVVIRTLDQDNKLMILRLPKRLSSKHDHHLNMHLFMDLIAFDTPDIDLSHNFYKLILEKVVQKSLCADEYSNCPYKECSAYIEKQCPKSCGLCDVNKPLPVCSFPRRFRGTWYMQDTDGVHNVNISDSVFSVQSVGSFNCIQYEDSPPSKERIYTTETIFSNGCRPRFTCISFRRLSQSVISYAISQSYTWPFTHSNPGSAICKSDRFQPDGQPIGDKFRNYADTHKPLLPVSRSLHAVNCRLDSAYNFDAVIKNKGNCSGQLYQDCKNSSLIRIDYSNCRLYPSIKTYACAARFKDRYWETLTILQNIHESKESLCLVVSTMKEGRALLMPTSQCDKYSWQFVDNKLRTPEVIFDLKETGSKCMHIPITTLPPPSTYKPFPVPKHQEQSDVHIPSSSSEKFVDDKQSEVMLETSTTSEVRVNSETKNIVYNSPHSGTSRLSNTSNIVILSICILVMYTSI